MNGDELVRNEDLTEWIVKDLNQAPAIFFPTFSTQFNLGGRIDQFFFFFVRIPKNSLLFLSRPGWQDPTLAFEDETFHYVVNAVSWMTNDCKKNQYVVSQL